MLKYFHVRFVAQMERHTVTHAIYVWPHAKMDMTLPWFMKGNAEIIQASTRGFIKCKTFTITMDICG